MSPVLKDILAVAGVLLPFLVSYLGIRASMAHYRKQQKSERQRNANAERGTDIIWQQEERKAWEAVHKFDQDRIAGLITNNNLLLLSLAGQLMWQELVIPPDVLKSRPPLDDDVEDQLAPYMVSATGASNLTATTVTTKDYSANI